MNKDTGKNTTAGKRWRLFPESPQAVLGHGLVGATFAAIQKNPKEMESSGSKVFVLHTEWSVYR